MHAFIGDLMKNRQRGVTLIELMTVLLVVAIIASIAVPSYRKYLLRAQRADAKTALLQAQTAEEKFLLQQNTYTANVTGAQPGGLGLTGKSENNFYDIAIVLTNVAGVPGYTITAAPGAGSGQADDTDCVSFTLNEQGVRTALDAGSVDNTATCWK
jgi:type IV pilus assembly protein PilE